MTPSLERPGFINVLHPDALLRESEHGGIGAILFRRVLGSGAFDSNIDFVDFTLIPPGSSIGRHRHLGNEELYYVANGDPYIAINGNGARCPKGTISVVRHGDSHELINDTAHPVEILVIQVSLPGCTR